MSAALVDRLHLVLRHDGVQNRAGQAIDASVTQVDLHDLCRLARTFGLAGVHCITPLPSQQALVAELSAFWNEGYGASYNPDRREALALLRVWSDFEAAIASIGGAGERSPIVLGSSAATHQKNLAIASLSTIITGSGRPVVLCLGTAWGMSEAQLNRCDWVLPPVTGRGGYNHLSVRCAAAILLDRLIHSSASNHQETSS